MLRGIVGAAGKPVNDSGIGRNRPFREPDRLRLEGSDIRPYDFRGSAGFSGCSRAVRASCRVEVFSCGRFALGVCPRSPIDRRLSGWPRKRLGSLSRPVWRAICPRRNRCGSAAGRATGRGRPRRPGGGDRTGEPAEPGCRVEGFCRPLQPGHLPHRSRPPRGSPVVAAAIRSDWLAEFRPSRARGR